MPKLHMEHYSPVVTGLRTHRTSLCRVCENLGLSHPPTQLKISTEMSQLLQDLPLLLTNIIVCFQNLGRNNLQNNFPSLQVDYALLTLISFSDSSFPSTHCEYGFCLGFVCLFLFFHSETEDWSLL